MIIMVGGSRDYKDVQGVQEWARKFDLKDVLIHGNCQGSPDVWAGQIISRMGAVVGEFDYVQTWGKAGGHLRNRAMVDIADKCVFFWDGKSSGTGKTIEYARMKNKSVTLFKLEAENG